MRVLCLKFLRKAQPCWAEIFTLYSPKVHFREPDLLFLEVHEVSHLFGGEVQLLQRVRSLAEQNLSLCSAAIANSPYWAQFWAMAQDGKVTDPSHEEVEISAFALEELIHLEGLTPFDRPSRVQYMINYFRRLGFKKIEDLFQFSSLQLKERFGSLGEQLYQRLHNIEKQTLSPLIPQAPFSSTTVCEHLIGQTQFLIHELEKSLKPLFLRLHARAFYARDLRVKLLCEYSNGEHVFYVQPTRPHRDLGLFLQLIKLKCEEIHLENPVKDIILEIGVTPERVEQLSLLEPTRFDHDKLVGLLSQFEQVGVQAGYLQYREEFLPEKSWGLISEYVPDQNFSSSVEYAPRDATAYKRLPVWSEQLKTSPRPTRLLRKPHLLPKKYFLELKLLNQWGSERIEDEWWDQYKERIYYLALNSQKQGLWIFLDLQLNEYFLHGYFD